MRLSEIGGETGWIERLRETHAGVVGDGLAVSLGDDAALLDAEPGRQFVVTTDMLVEGIHFRHEWSDPYSIGWKAAAANLSDIAAMGADPSFAFLSLAFPPRETVEGMERLLDGFTDCLNRYGARLAGGDTNAAPVHLIVSVTLMGRVPAGRALLRHGARVGDALLVTGTLGDAAAGLALLGEHGLARAEKKGRDLVLAHRRPMPRVIAGRAARETGKVHAAMDISDGMAADLPKLCAASGVGARVDIAHLPVSDALRQAAKDMGRDPLDFALDGGEDYELLLAVPPQDAKSVQAAIEDTGMACVVVGEVIKSGLRLLTPDGERDLPARGGWDHFAP